MDINSVIQLEEKLNSLKEENLFNITIDTTLYPYIDNYILTQPFKFQRTSSEIHVNPKCEYYFNSKTNELKFCLVKWGINNQIDFNKLNNYSDYSNLLINDLKHKNEYQGLFEHLNIFLIEYFGKPTIEIIKLENIIIESYIWKKENATIKTFFQYPKKNKLDLTHVEYVMYFK